MYDILWQKKAGLIALCCLITTIISVTTAHAQLRDRINLPNSDEKFYSIGIVIMGAQSRFQLSQHQYFLQSDTVLVSNPSNTIGIGIGGMHTFRISNRFEARVVFPQLLFVNKKLEYTLKYPDPWMDDKVVVSKDVESILLGVPIQLKLKSDRIGNFRVYMMGGVKFEYDLSSKANQKNAENYIKLKGSDFGVEGGIGFNIYMPYFILSPEIKISNGISNVHARDPNLKYSSAIDKIQSRQIIFSLIFEG